MKRLSAYVQLKRIIACDGKPAWIAIWRGTANRVNRADGSMVSISTTKSGLLFDLKNNPMENGVIVNHITHMGEMVTANK